MRYIPYFDAHCDALHYCMTHGEELFQTTGQCDLRRLNRYRPWGQIFAIYCDSAEKTPAELEEILSAQFGIYFRARAAFPEEMANCHLSIEGAELMGCDPTRLAEMRGWGVRSVNLTWNHSNALSGAVSSDSGLTDLGKIFVKEAQDWDIYIDVSHLSDRGFWELAELTEMPIIATHSNSREVCPAKRNLTDDMFRQIRDSGGVVGLNLYSHFVAENAKATDLIPHLEHFLELEGEDTLCFGCDFDGSDWLSSGLRGVEDMGDLYDLLEQRGYGDDLLEKLFYKNLAKLF